MQWFAEEGAVDEAARTGDTAPDAGEQENFAALIRGRYKADFDARVQKILDGRLRETDHRKIECIDSGIFRTCTE